jgi:hypothetical protein
MLVRQDVAGLCLECHSTIMTSGGASGAGTLGGIPPGFHDLRSARFNNCTLCHVKIHGSQASKDFLR